MVPAGAPAPAGSLAVDGDPPGAAAYLSHWRGTPPPPPALAADSSAGMALRAAADPARWLDPFPIACNNHLDADGLLALIACCRPALARDHAARIEGAAEAGDFCAWPGQAAFRLLLAVHQHLRAHAGDAQACAATAVEQAETLLAAADCADAERDAQVAQVEAAIAARAGAVALRGPLAVVPWRRRLGHAWDQFGAVYAPDDLPLWALAAHIPEDRFQLLLEEADDGQRCCLDAPRHSWARTVRRPAVPWPDLAPLAAALQAEERGPGRWVAGAAARTVGFTTLLACVGGEGAPAPTSMDPERLAARCRAALAAPTGALG